MQEKTDKSALLWGGGRHLCVRKQESTYLGMLSVGLPGPARYESTSLLGLRGPTKQ